MSVYIQPSEGWEGWREQDTKSLNLTWEVKELTTNTMKIKLDLDNPVSVSPILRYDRLVIFFKDVRVLFIDTRERRLSGTFIKPSVLQSTMDAGI